MDRSIISCLTRKYLSTIRGYLLPIYLKLSVRMLIEGLYYLFYTG